MLLYHGTRASFLPHIAVHGIKPRTHKKRGNWKHTVPSNSRAVYLTAGYALYFAVNALPAKSLMNRTAVVLEVDTDKLDPLLLLPDEDAVEQTSRGWDDLPKDWSMLKRTLWYRKNMQGFIGTDAWEKSVKALGTAAYWGTIPAKAITRTAVVDLSIIDPHFVIASLDPTITTMNWKLCGAKYKNLTRFLFGDPLAPDENDLLPHADWLAHVSRDGIEVFGPLED